MTIDFNDQNESTIKPVLAVADTGRVQQIIDEWPALPRQSAQQTIGQYGYPNDAGYSQLTWYNWYNNGPWKRTIVYRDEIAHDFPQPHADVIENVIDYRVPSGKCSDLARFYVSIVVAKGEVSARCDMEAANILALNFMHYIVTGKLTVESARKQYGEVMATFMLNRPAPYAEQLQFQVPYSLTGEHDGEYDQSVAASLLHQAKEKINDVRKKDS